MRQKIEALGVLISGMMSTEAWEARAMKESIVDNNAIESHKEPVEPNTMKRRMILLWKLLYDQTDENHPVSTYDIVDYMAEHGIKVSRKTIKPDIDLMCECGFDIVKVSSKPNKLDAVSSSRFITSKKSADLKRKITGLASVHQRKQLSRHIYTTSVIKPRNENIYYIVDAINDAIETKQKISFNIIEFDGNKNKILRHDGEVYSLSPYALYWNDDFYYAIGWSDKHGDIVALRVDRMENLQVLEEKAVKRPKDFKVSDYSHKVFEMFNGEETRVKLQCKNELMKYVIDRFGDKVETEPTHEDKFICYVNVRLSPTFYGWVFGFGGDIRILAPSEAVEEIIDMSKRMITAESM